MEKIPTNIDPMSRPPGIINASILDTSTPNRISTTESPHRVQGGGMTTPTTPSGAVGPISIVQQSAQQIGGVGALAQPFTSPIVVTTSTGSQTPQASVGMSTSTPTNNVMNGVARPLVVPQQSSQQQSQPVPHTSSLGGQLQTPMVSTAPGPSTATSHSRSQMDAGAGGSQPNTSPDASLTQQESRAKQQSARRCAINFLKIYYRTLSANSKDLLRYYDLNACLDRISCGEFQNDEMTGMSLQSLRHILRNFGSVLRVTIKLIDYQYSRDDNVLISVHGAMQFDQPINPSNMDETNGVKRGGGSHLVPPGTDVGFLQIFYLTRNSKGWWVIQNDIFRFMNDGHLRVPSQSSFVPVSQPMDTMLGLSGHSQANDGPRSSPLQNSLHGYSPNMHSVGTSRSMGPTVTTNSTQTPSQTVLGSDFSTNDGQYRRPVNPIVHGTSMSGVNGENERSRRRMPRVNHSAGTMTMETRRRPQPMNEMSGHSASTPHSGSGTPSGRSGRRGSSGSLPFSFSTANGGSGPPVSGHRNQQRPSSSHGQPFQRQSNGQYDMAQEIRGQPRSRHGSQYFSGPDRRGNGRHGPRSGPEHGIFVKLDAHVTSDELKEACRDFGEVENVQLYAEKKFAFVFFKNHDGMIRAVNGGKCILRGVEHSIQKKRPQKERGDHFPIRGDSTHGMHGPSSRRGHRAPRGSGHDNSRPSSKSRSSRQGEKSGREGDPARQSRDRIEGRGKQGKPGSRGTSGPSHTNSNSSTSGSSPKKGGKKNKPKQPSQFQSRDREKSGINKTQVDGHIRVIFSGDGDGDGYGQKENVNLENVSSSQSKQPAQRELETQM